MCCANKCNKNKRYYLQPRDAGVRFLEIVVAFATKEFEQRRSKLTY